MRSPERARGPRSGVIGDVRVQSGALMTAPGVVVANELVQDRVQVQFGERTILLAGVHGIVESLYRRFSGQGLTDEDAFRHSTESITGPISRIISKKDGLDGVYRRLCTAEQAVFADAYAASYPVGFELTHKIYDEVASGNEIRSVVQVGKRCARFRIGKIDQADMWKVGAKVCIERIEADIPLDPSPQAYSAAR